MLIVNNTLNFEITVDKAELLSNDAVLKVASEKIAESVLKAFEDAKHMKAIADEENRSDIDFSVINGGTIRINIVNKKKAVDKDEVQSESKA